MVFCTVLPSPPLQVIGEYTRGDLTLPSRRERKRTFSAIADFDSFTPPTVADRHIQESAIEKRGRTRQKRSGTEKNTEDENCRIRTQRQQEGRGRIETGSERNSLS